MSAREPKEQPKRGSRKPNRFDQVWCATDGKYGYRGKREARKARKALHPGEHLVLYPCEVDGMAGCFHLGHLPYHVLNRGITPRNNEYVKSLGVAQ